MTLQIITRVDNGSLLKTINVSPGRGPGLLALDQFPQECIAATLEAFNPLCRQSQPAMPSVMRPLQSQADINVRALEFPELSKPLGFTHYPVSYIFIIATEN